MKVILCLNDFLPFQMAGIEVFTWALSKQLQNKNVVVEVVIPNYVQKKSAAFSAYAGVVAKKKTN